MDQQKREFLEVVVRLMPVLKGVAELVLEFLKNPTAAIEDYRIRANGASSFNEIFVQ